MINQTKRQVLAIIPARGGSKGLPRKNVLPLAGKPLIAWNIEAALATKSISRLVVSTDDVEIAKVAHRYGAEVVERPAEIAGDVATSESALLHTLEHLKETDTYTPDLLVFLQCTSPLTTSNDIDNAVQTLITKEADSCLTAKDFHYFVWREGADGNASGVNHDKRYRPRRQDREPQFEENGAVYAMKTRGFKKHKHRFFGKTVISVMPADRSFEIDEPTDLKIAEMLIHEREKKNRIAKVPGNLKALVLDFDGVLTDNKVFVDQDGKEMVVCDRSDGWGLGQLKKTNMRMVVLSTEKNSVVAARCKKLGIDYQQGLGDSKYDAFRNWCQENNMQMSDSIFVGNDANDRQCLERAGCGVVPADAYAEVKRFADIVLANMGGMGAVREVCEMILQAKQKEVL